MFEQSYTWVVTGGAGFIGTHMVRELLKQKQRVVVLDNVADVHAAALAPLLREIRFIRGDVRDFDAVLNALKGADYALHLAALVSVPESVDNPQKTMDVNVCGTSNVLLAARVQRVKRVLLASSCAVYGNNPAIPYTEDSKVDIQSPYALSKYMGTRLCKMYWDLYGVETVALRYFNVYGPGQSAQSSYAAVIAKFIDLARRGQPFTIEWDGRQTRDFTFVQDIVNATLLAAIKGTPGEIYNVASGKSCSLLELLEHLDRLNGTALPRVFLDKRKGDVKNSSADISKIGALGFIPRTSLQEGLKIMWESFR